MVRGSRSRRAPRRGGGGGRIGGFIFALLLLGGIFAFYQIPINPSITGFTETLKARSDQVGIWVRDFVDNLLSWEFNPTVPTPNNPGNGGDGTTIPGDTPAPVDELRNTLNSLPVENAAGANYNRDEWKHWNNITSCWNVREQVLVTEAADDGTLILLDKNDIPTTDLSKACKVAEGTWVDPYTGKTIHDPKEIDIDHMIPLNYVAQHGGQAWDANKKQAYANNLDYANHLLAVSSSANRSKSDKGPGDWKPENQAYWCTYATDWINISTEWSLSITQKDKDALNEMLNTCAV